MSILAFQMPDRVVMSKADDFYGIFEFKPLERGYGVTIGNSLRRVLLSSLEGHAVVGVRFQNGSVLHEFTSIPGVVEDVVEIILNIKMLRFKKKGETVSNKINVSVSGRSVVTAGDVGNSTNDFEVMNPEFVICHIDPSTTFEMELTIDKGRGYVPSEENRVGEQVVGYIPVDSIFTPIKKVKYSVENTRVEQKTDYEKLILEIETDGTIHPERALEGAANILMQHLRLFTKHQDFAPVNIKGVEETPIDEEYLHMRKLLKTSLADLDLSVRAYNCLKAADVKTLGDLVKLEISDMMKFRNFGKKSLTELEQLMTEKGLSFGMDVSKYRLDED